MSAPEDRAVDIFLGLTFVVCFLTAFWGGAIYALAWFVEQPAEVQLCLGGYAAAVGALLLGFALIYAALTHIGRPTWQPWSPCGRRPAGAKAGRPEARPLPPRVDVAHGPTALPPAGRQALSPRSWPPVPRRHPPCAYRYEDHAPEITDEDVQAIARLHAGGMGRRRRGRR